MDGRLGNEQRIEDKIKWDLALMPDEVTGWYTSLKAAGITPTTRYNYVRIVSRMFSFIVDNHYYLNSEGVAEYLQSIRTREENGKMVETSDSYKNMVWHCLNNFFEYLLKENVIPENYISSIKKPQNHDLERINENRVILTEEDLKRIIQAVIEDDSNNTYGYKYTSMHSRNILIILLLITTGMKVTKLTEINVEDVDFAEKTISIIDKGDKSHIYYLTDNIVAYLNDWLVDRSDLLEYAETESKALFISAQGTRIVDHTVRELVYKYSEKATGKRLSPQTLRSAFVNTVYNQTHDIEFARRAVGHANVSTTQRYIVTDKSERKQSTDIMEKVLGITKPEE